MKIKSTLIILTCLLFYGNVSLSQTVLSGIYEGELTLTYEDSPYLVADSAIFNCWLFIEPEVIITFKFHPDPAKKAYIRFTLPVEARSVIFTSERDNMPHDLNGDGTATRPAAGDWGYIYFDPLAPEDGSYIFENSTIRYGGGRKFSNEPDPGKYPMVIVSDYNRHYQDFPRVELANCTIEHSAGTGILAGMVLLRNSVVKNNNYGIRMVTSDANIISTEISNNTIYPVYLTSPVLSNKVAWFNDPVINYYEDNQVFDNGLDVIAMEGIIGYAKEEGVSLEYPAVNLENHGLPYLITNDLVIDSLILHVNQGNLIKFLPEIYTGKPVNILLKNKGTLSVLGSEQEKVVFTSLHDYQYDNHGTVNAGPKPVAGDWGIIAGRNLQIENTIFRYGGKYVNKSGNVVADSSAVLHIYGADPEQGWIVSCLFRDLYAHGVFVPESALEDWVYLENNSFIIGQNRYGIITPEGLEPTENRVHAQRNFWNGGLGPFHPDSNPQGNGCKVGDHVDFSGFITDSDYGLANSVIRGVVRNSEGPLENTLVRLNSKNSRTTYTDHNGGFYFGNVQPGAGYQMEFIYAAHRDSIISPLDIPADTSMYFEVTLNQLTIDYLVDTVLFNINPKISTVSLGGTAHRYYRIIDKYTGKPVYGAEVIVPGLETFYSDSKGIVDIAISSGNALGSKSFYIQRVGKGTLDYPENERIYFTVNVLPFEYNKIWSGNTYFKVGAFGIEAKKERGASIDLFVRNDGSGERGESILFSRQNRTGLGLNFGAAAKLELGPIEAGAEAGMGVNFDAIFEDDFKFHYENPSGKYALAKFIVLADGALPYMDAPLTRYFVVCLERQVAEIEAAALTNGIGMNLYAWASADAGIDLNLTEVDQGTLGAQMTGSASAKGGITFMSRLYAHKNPVTGKYPLDIDYDYTGEMELGVTRSIGFDIGKLLGSNEGTDKDNGEETGPGFPFPAPGLTLASASAAGGIKYGLHFGTTRFVPEPYCRLGFMYGYKYDLKAGALLPGEKKISENREIRYNFDFYDEVIFGMVSQSADLAKSMLSSSDLIDLNISDLVSGKIFNSPMNSIAHHHSRNSFSVPPVPYQKTITDQVNEGGFNIDIDVGAAIVRATFGAGFNFTEVNQYPKETGLFYNWQLYPLESYEYLTNNDGFSARPILQDIVSESASYIVNEIKQNLIPPIFRKINVWPFRRKSILNLYPIGPESRASFIHFADTTAITLEGIDSLDVVYWDWYGTGENTKSSLKSTDPSQLIIPEYIKKSAVEIHKMDYGIGGFYQFEPYNTSVGDHEVSIIINYFDDELTVMLPDSSIHNITETDLRMYREDKENNRWVFIGGVVDTENNTVRARIDAFGTFTLAPFVPSGEILLSASPDTIDLDLGDTSTITSAPIYYNTELMVADGELFTLKASRGTFSGTDADPERPDFQVAAANGKIEAVFKADVLSGDVVIIAESLMGDAAGVLELFVSDSEPPEPPVLAGIEMEEHDVRLWWQKNDEPDLMQYLIHYDTISGGPYNGTASVFGTPSPINAGLDSTRLVSGLMAGVTYYFTVTAIDRCGNESGYSNELSLTTEFNRRPVFYHKIIHIDSGLENGTVVDTLSALDPDEGQSLTFYFTGDNAEEAFALDPKTGILTVSNENRLNYSLTGIDAFLLKVGVRDDAVNSLSDEGEVMIILSVIASTEQVKPVYQPSLLEMYPNPARDNITLKLGEAGNSDRMYLRIFSLDGKCCFSASYTNINNSEMVIPVHFLENGIYYVVMEFGAEKRSGKILIFR